MQFKKIGSFLWETFKLAVISLLIILPIRYFLVEPFFVLGASMEPNFQNGDYLVINEIGYLIGDPARGDIVVFQYPHNPRECQSITYQFTHSKDCPYYIKRVIALPGESITINEKGILIKNAEKPKGFFLEETYLPNKEVYGNVSMELGNAEYFVMGDNRSHSSDSRLWGPLPRSYMVGKVLLRAFPFDKAQVY